MAVANTKQKSLMAKRGLIYVVLFVLLVLSILPFWLMLVNATRSTEQIAQGVSFLPSHYLSYNYGVLTGRGFNIVRGFLNSFIIAAGSTLLTLYFSAMTAYALVIYEFKAKKYLFALVAFILMIPSQLSLIGFYQMMLKVNLVDSFIPLIVPAIASPVVFFYMKQSMDAGLPKELLESARIDGAGEFRIFNQIALPLMKPSIAVQAIFSFVSSWNNYFTPALILKKDNKKTLPILIALLRGADFLKFDMGQVYMFIACSILPVIIVYLCLAKNIVAGMTSGAVKG